MTLDFSSQSQIKLTILPSFRYLSSIFSKLQVLGFCCLAAKENQSVQGDIGLKGSVFVKGIMQTG